MNKKYLAFGVLSIFTFVFVSAALLNYYGEVTQDFQVEQAVTLSGDSCIDNICTEEAINIYSPDIRVNGIYKLKNNDPSSERLSLLISEYIPEINNEEIQTQYYIASQSSIIAGADRLVETQNNDGSWEWNNPDTDKTDGPGPGNTYGVTAMGLLYAYEITGNQVYLDTAKITADDLVDKIPHKTEGKFYSQDIEFLVNLGEISGESVYTDKAVSVMEHFMTGDNRYCDADGCTAEELAAFYEDLYPTSAGLTEWQLSSWVRAADLTAEAIWSDDMVIEIEDDVSTNYFDITLTTGNYVIGLAGVLDATGSEDVAEQLLATQEVDGSWTSENPEGDVQDVAYAVMALAKKGGYENLYGAVIGAVWLENNQGTESGWENNANVENTELTSEALWAIPLRESININLSPGGSTPVYIKNIFNTDGYNGQIITQVQPIIE